MKDERYIQLKLSLWTTKTILLNDSKMQFNDDNILNVMYTAKAVIWRKLWLTTKRCGSLHLKGFRDRATSLKDVTFTCNDS